MRSATTPWWSATTSSITASKNLDQARAEAHFPWLAANAEVTGGDAKPFAHYLLKTVGGVKVAVIGVTTPAVPSWEKPENVARYKFQSAKAAVEKSLAELRALPAAARPDLILVAAHAGLERDPKTGAILAEAVAGENMVYEIATSVPGIDAIVYGHTHAEAAEIRLNGVLLTQPKNWGILAGGAHLRARFEARRRLHRRAKEQPPDPRDQRHRSRSGDHAHRQALP